MAHRKLEARLKSCTCEQCIDSCRHYPGWMTPDEADAAIAAGLADKLACDWLSPSEKFGNEGRIFVLAPAPDDRGGRYFPEIEEMHGFVSELGLLGVLVRGMPYPGRCVFLQNGRCVIHESGFKPIHCRLSTTCIRDDGAPTKFDVAELWDTERGRNLIARWKSVVGMEDGVAVA